MARIFIVDGTEYPDPGSEVTPEQFKQMMAGFLPEMATAEMTESRQGDYSLGVPPQSQTAASVTYETLPGTVLDIHSHTGGVPAQFSSIDDRDEQGFCLYAVVGGLLNLCPTLELRLGVYGYFMSLRKENIFV